MTIKTARLKPIVKKLWINALRSGNYQKATKILHNGKDNTFCCLGVLCDIHRTKALKKGTDLWEDKNGNNCKTYFNYEDVPPNNVISWAFAVESANPIIPIMDLPIEIRKLVFEALYIRKVNSLSRISLAELNDKINLSFNQIADVIEKCL